MSSDPSKFIDLVLKSIEFRQNLVVLLLGGAGFALAKSWPDRTNQPDRKAFRRLLPCLFLGAISLIAMLVEHRLLAQALSRDSATDFAAAWLNTGEPTLDVLIVSTAFALLIGLRK